MNRYIIAFFTIFISFIFTSRAQNYDIGLGGGLNYGSSINNIGLNFRGEVTFFNQWSIVPHFNLFFNKDRNPGTKKWNAFNVDGHYFFEVDRMLTVYPLFGFNFATVSEKVNDITYSNAEIGINLGFGAAYQFDPRLSGFGEIKYVISKADQAVVTVGLLYLMNR